jgi:hypothetical protein
MLYKEPYKLKFKTKEQLSKQHNISLKSQWIFFPENYNLAFYDEKTLDIFIAKGQSRDDVQEMVEYCKQSLKEVFGWLIKVAAKNKNFEIIIRPRPLIDIENFKDYIKNNVSESLLENIKIIQEETVREWVLASDIVLSSHSTTLLEAVVAKKEAYMLTPYNMPEQLKVEWQNFFIKVKTFEDFERYMKQNKNLNSKAEEWINQTFFIQKDSINAIADSIFDVYKNRTINKIPIKLFFYRSKNFILNFLILKLLRIKIRLFGRKKINIDKDLKKEILTDAEKQTFLNKWTKIL